MARYFRIGKQPCGSIESVKHSFFLSLFPLFYNAIYAQKVLKKVDESMMFVVNFYHCRAPVVLNKKCRKDNFRQARMIQIIAQFTKQKMSVG
jgi:hypothetical protein